MYHWYSPWSLTLIFLMDHTAKESIFTGRNIGIFRKELVMSRHMKMFFSLPIVMHNTFLFENTGTYLCD